MHSGLLRAGGAILIAVSGLATADAQITVRGRVSGAGDAPVSGATVSVTPAGGAAKTVATTGTGAYVLSTTPADLYSINVTAVGFAAQRREVRRAAADTVVVVNFTLLPGATQLPRVQTVAERPKPPRSETGFDNSIGGQVSFPDVTGGLSGDVTGDFAAAMSLMPGFSVIPDGAGGAIPTIGGVPSDQSAVVLNGLAFGGNIPRDGFRVGIVSTAYDAGRGGFAGSQVSLRMASGANLIARNIHATFDAPALQVTTPSARALGGRYSQMVASGQAFGSIKPDRSFYSVAYQLQRRANFAPSLLTADPAALRSWRSNPDSLARFLAATRTLRIPTEAASFSNQRETNEGRIAVRLDYSPNPAILPSLTNSITALSDDYFVEFGGSWRSTGGVMIAPSTLPSTGGRQTHGDGWIQATAAKYLPHSLLGETSVGFSAGQDRLNPYLALPAARVLVASALDDGSSGLALYQAGGSSAAPGTNSTWTAEARQQFTRMTWDRHHSTALTLDAIVDHAGLSQDASRGLFTYNSIGDLAANRAATFARTLGARDASANAYQLALGIGDQFQPGPAFRAQYGVRLEANGILSHAPYNRTVDSVFGRRTDATPTSLAILPMAGFAWQTLGYIALPQIANSVARGFITGGVRRYRGTMASRLFANTIQQSGNTAQVFCVGDAVPTPNWPAYANSASAIPTECVGSSTFSESAPPVSLVASDYRPVSSWRANLNVNYRLTAPLQLTLAGTHALNRDLPGAIDLNLNDAPKSAIAGEASRPVFVPATSIVPSTGAVAWSGSRQTSLLSHVTETRANLTSNVGTYSVALAYAPVVFSQTSSTANITYAFTVGREESFGFTGTTAGDPTMRERSIVGLPAHAVTVSLTRRREGLGTLGLAVRAQSGYRYTPLVAGDINGDGYVNDRAFILPSSNAEMSRLLSTTSDNARRCLEKQAGQIAGRNSCTAPWSIPTVNLSIAPDPYRLGFGNRGSMNLYLINVLAGLDQALHGSNLRGWGQWSSPDPTLLVVRGYDPTASRFLYSVNPLFGNSSVYRSAFRAPFALTLDFKIELGPDREGQLMRNTLRPRTGGRADSLSVAAVKAKIDQAINPFSALTAQLRDSLKLTPQQVDSVRAVAQRYATSRDSIVTLLSRYLADRRGDYDNAEVRERWHAAVTEIIRVGAVRGKDLVRILTSEQMARLRMQILGIAAVRLADLDPRRAELLTRTPVGALP